MEFLPGNPSISSDGRCTIHVGDVMERLRDLPDDFVDLVVTSPPYWGLRDYGTAAWVGGDPACAHQPIATTRTPWANGIKGPNGGRTIDGFRETSRARHTGGYCALCGAERVDYQIGLEQTLGQHIEAICDVFDEIWRVLKPTGSVFLNYGDCYATEPAGRSAAETKAAGGDDRTFRDKPFSTVGPIYQSDGHSPRVDPRRRMHEAWFDPGYANGRGVFTAAQWNRNGAGTRRIDHGGRVVAGGVLKNKDLCMIPNRIAIALQERGWWVRSEIVWGKSNAMPDSSGISRPSTAHEKIWLLTKNAEADIWVSRDTHELSFKPNGDERCVMPTTIRREPPSAAERKAHTWVEVAGGWAKEGPRWIRLGAYYDASAVLQESSPNSHPRLAQNIDGQEGSHRAHGGKKHNGPMKAVANSASKVSRGIRNNPSYDEAMKSRDRKRGLTPRHQGHINHTGLDELGRGTGRFLRNYEPPPATVPAPLPVWEMATRSFKEAHFATFPPELVERAIKCGAPPDGGIVLDPFGGSGTTALVALRLGRRCHLIELKPEYAEMAKRRLELDWMGPDERAHATAKAKAEKEPPPPLPLFDGPQPKRRRKPRPQIREAAE